MKNIDRSAFLALNSMNRRKFIELVSMGISFPTVASSLQGLVSAAVKAPENEATKAYGSGYFGEWITDPFGLPAYGYTCNQITDPKALSPVHKEWRSPTDHTHQVGNDRLVAAVSNLRLPAGAPGRGLAEIPQRLLSRGGTVRSRYRLFDGRNTDVEHVLSRQRQLVRKNLWRRLSVRDG